MRAWVHPLNVGGKYPLAIVGTARMMFHWLHCYWITLNCILLCAPPNTTGRCICALMQKRFLSLYVDCKTAIKAYVIFGSVWLLLIKCRQYPKLYFLALRIHVFFRNCFSGLICLNHFISVAWPYDTFWHPLWHSIISRNFSVCYIIVAVKGWNQRLSSLGTIK